MTIPAYGVQMAIHMNTFVTATFAIFISALCSACKSHNQCTQEEALDLSKYVNLPPLQTADFQLPFSWLVLSELFHG